MPTDPKNIPQHVVDAAWEGWNELPIGQGSTFKPGGPMAAAIAAALDALMDTEPVELILLDDRGNRTTVGFPPSAMLAAVLAREAQRAERTAG